MDRTTLPISFEPISSRRTFEEVCDRIRARIESGDLKPGDKLPAERDLALQLGVGRNAVREAIRTLENRGILELRKGVKGGAFIRQGDPSQMDSVVQDMFSLGSITISELAEAREHVQDLVVRLACQRAGAADLAALEQNIARTRLLTEQGKVLERVECSRDFYRLLGSATGNSVLAMMVNSVTEILMQFVYARTAAGGAIKPGLVEDRTRFLDALAAKDEDRAANLMRQHLREVHAMFRMPASQGVTEATAKNR